MLKTTADAAESPPAPVRKRTDWNVEATQMLRGEMTRRGLSYKDLARMLEQEGVDVSDASLMTKVARGTFSLAWFLRVARLLGMSSVDISHLPAASATSKRAR